MKKILLLMILACAKTSAHELQASNPSAGMHALFHDATARFHYVDQQKTTALSFDGSRSTQLYGYFFDPVSNRLVKCSAFGRSNDSGLCNELENQIPQSAWSAWDLEYAKKNSLKPVDRVMHDAVPILEGKEPFSQFSQFIYFVGAGRVDRCRTTITQYKFSFERNGQTVYIDSTKKDEMQKQCDRIYPKT